MTKITSMEELTDIDFVADILKPMKLIAWGENAMRYLGVRTVGSTYMLGIADDEINLAIQLLLNAGFEQQTWPFSSTDDPAKFAGDEHNMYRSIQASVAPGYAKLTQSSSRFQHPDRQRCGPRIVLLPLSYIHLRSLDSPTSGVESSAEDMYKVVANVYYPDVPILLESFIQVYLENDTRGGWDSTLRTWIITYMYGQLSLGKDVLDASRDDAVKEWWNKEIGR